MEACGYPDSVNKKSLAFVKIISSLDGTVRRLSRETLVPQERNSPKLLLAIFPKISEQF